MGLGMTRSRRRRPSPDRWRVVELDTFRTAVGLAIVAGALALVAPYLDGLVAALAALAGAGWVATRTHRRTAGTAASGATALALAIVGAGVAAFLFLPEPWSSARGLALAGSWLPMWWRERTVGAVRFGAVAEAP